MDINTVYSAIDHANFSSDPNVQKVIDIDYKHYYYYITMQYVLIECYGCTC